MLQRVSNPSYRNRCSETIDCGVLFTKIESWMQQVISQMVYVLMKYYWSIMFITLRSTHTRVHFVQTVLIYVKNILNLLFLYVLMSSHMGIWQYQNKAFACNELVLSMFPFHYINAFILLKFNFALCKSFKKMVFHQMSF